MATDNCDPKVRPSQSNSIGGLNGARLSRRISRISNRRDLSCKKAEDLNSCAPRSATPPTGGRPCLSHQSSTKTCALERAGMIRNAPELGTVWAQLSPPTSTATVASPVDPVPLRHNVTDSDAGPLPQLGSANVPWLPSRQYFEWHNRRHAME